jgi:phage terminase large subunit
LVEEHIANPNQQTVCIREIQKSLKFSAKKLIEDKIIALGVSHLFEVTLTEIRRIGGQGIIIFQGMQDHTADSIKSLEGFDRAWVEEAQSISMRSMELLLPTIRAPGSEIWFSWNPDQEDDPVEKLFSSESDDVVKVHVNYTENPFLPDELLREAERHRKQSPETFDHVWLGGYNIKSERLVFMGKHRIGTMDTSGFDPMYGIDFGFAQDPTTAIECFLINNSLYVSRECGKIGLELDYTSEFIKRHIDSIDKYVIRADSARPESRGSKNGQVASRMVLNLCARLMKLWCILIA